MQRNELSSPLMISQQFTAVAVGIATCLLCFVGVGSLKADDTTNNSKEALIPLERWSGCFGGEKVTLNYEIQGEVPANGRIVWSHVVDRRVLSRGEQSVSANGPEPVTARVELEIPEVREGIVFETQLRVELLNRDGSVAAEDERVLRVFANDPFANRQTWLQEQQIVLCDPVGDTAKIFDGQGIPYTLARSLSVLQATTDGLIVVGEGISWRSPSSFSSVLIDLAVQGRSVICLAPADGSLPFPGTDEATGTPRRITLRRSDIITELDKRLDAIEWPPNGRIVRSALQITSQRGRVVLSVTDSPSAWPWVEMSFASGGRLTVCGFAVIRQWESGPTPRYLFARLLEKHSKKSDR